MDLKGSIKERPTLDLLASMAREKTSGILSLSKGKEGIQVHWSLGKIVQVTPSPSPKQGNLGQMMIDIGQISSNQLEQALQQQRRSLAPLGDILVRVFHCDRQQILRVLRVQAIERLYVTFFWKSGDYSFESKPITAPVEHFEPIEIEALVQEAVPVLSLWPKARKRFHSPQLEIEAIGPSLPAGLALGGLEQKVFSFLATGLFRFRELSILSGLGQFPTACALQKLQEHQLIIVRSPQQKRFSWLPLLLGSSLLEFFVWLLVMGMLVGAGTYLLAFAPYSPMSLLQPTRSVSVTAPGWEQSVETWRLQRIRTALRLHHIQWGHYPSQLHVFYELGWLAAEHLLSTTGKPFFYQRVDPHHYRLLLPLP